MTTWIFQGNMDAFDVTQYVQSNHYIYWAVKHRSHQNELSLGDFAYIWRARGRSSQTPGIVAFGVVVEPVKSKQDVDYPEYLSEFLWTDPAAEVSHKKVGVRLLEKRMSPEEGMLSLYNIRLDPVLSRMRIVTARVGTNFRLSDQEADRISSLWNPEDVSMEETISAPKISAPEARIIYRLHRSRERNTGIVTRAKQNYLSLHGHLACELCGFDYSEKYGSLGEGFIEVHHKKPISAMKEGEETHIDDLMLVCSSCHRMIHRGDYLKNLQYLTALFGS